MIFHSSSLHFSTMLDIVIGSVDVYQDSLLKFLPWEKSFFVLIIFFKRELYFIFRISDININLLKTIFTPQGTLISLVHVLWSFVTCLVFFQLTKSSIMKYWYMPSTWHEIFENKVIYLWVSFGWLNMHPQTQLKYDKLNQFNFKKRYQ